MEKSPLVSIIIVSFNTKKLTLECIASLTTFVKSSYEVIVVDNASEDGTVAALSKLTRKYKSLQIIKNKDNKGFAAANNQGIEIAKGEYVLLLNSDTYLSQDAISPIVRHFQKNPLLGVASCQLQNKDGSLQASGGFFPTPLRLFFWMFFIDDIPVLRNFLTPFHPQPSFYKVSRELDWVTGAFFMFPRALTEKIGRLDEEYFMYVEELDFCYRAKKEGFKVHLFTDSSIVHLGQASSTNEFALVSEFRNISLFYQKHLSSYSAYAKLMLTLGGQLRAFLYGIFGKSAQRTIYEKAIQSL